MELELDPSADPSIAFHTEDLGRVTVDDLTAGHMMEVEEILGGKEISPEDLTDALLAVLARTDGGELLTRQQIGRLSKNEKEEFAELFLKSQDHFFHHQVPIYKNDEHGKTIISYGKGKISLPRNSNETASNYLYRGWMKYRETMRAVAHKLVGPAIDIAKFSKWASPSTLDAIAKNAAISGALSKNIAAMQVLQGLNFASASPLFKAEMAIPGLPERKSDAPETTSSGLAACRSVSAADFSSVG